MKTLQEVKAILSYIEPDETMYAKLSEEDIPNLQLLLQDNEPWLAARVIFALGRLNSTNANNIILQATQDQRSEVRVAIAASASMLPAATADRVLNALIEDRDIGVKKFAIKSISNTSNIQLKDKLRVLSQREPNEQIKILASEKLMNLR